MERKACSLSGLRGLASLHVMLFHLFLESGLNVSLHGGVEMPLFYLLSGFSLVLAYGKVRNDGTFQDINFRSFIQNRAARILPVYYLINMISFFDLFWNLPLKEISSDELRLRLLLTVSCMNTWFYPWTYSPLFFVSWTVPTLAFFYLLFPFVIKRFEKFSNQALTNMSMFFFYLQLTYSLPLALAEDFLVTDNPKKGLYWMVTANPVFRLPIFVMGVLAGIQHVRTNSGLGLKGDYMTSSVISDWMPLPKISFMEEQPVDDHMAMEVAKRRSNFNALGILILLFSCTLVTFLTGDTNILRYNYILQLVLPHAQLMLITGLANDNGTSSMAKICQSPSVQFLGYISMALYLFHVEVKIYVCNFYNLSLGPYSCISTSALGSVLVAWLVVNGFEEPLRKRFRTRPKASLAENKIFLL